MKTIGILGGISTESTATYYAAINAGVRERLGGFNSARQLIYSVNYEDIRAAQDKGDWQSITNTLTAAARGLEQSGADFVLLACNTVHKIAPALEAAIHVPFLHIVDTCAASLIADKRRRPALLGTLFTMEDGFFVDRLSEAGLCPLTPDAETRVAINHIIHTELTLGIVKLESAAYCVRAIETLKAAGADNVILGCTELGMLLNANNSPLPTYDTALIHCDAAVDLALAEVSRKAGPAISACPIGDVQ